MRVLVTYILFIAFAVGCSGTGQVVTNISRQKNSVTPNFDEAGRATGHPERGQSIAKDIVDTTVIFDDLMWFTQLALPQYNVTQVMGEPRYESPKASSIDSIDQQSKILGGTCVQRAESTGYTLVKFKNCSKSMSRHHRMVFSGEIKVCRDDMSACGVRNSGVKIAIVLESENSLKYQVVDATTNKASAVIQVQKLEILLSNQRVNSLEVVYDFKAERVSQIVRGSRRANVPARRGQVTDPDINLGNPEVQTVTFSIPSAVLSLVPTEAATEQFDPQVQVRQLTLAPTGIKFVEEKSSVNQLAGALREINLTSIDNKPITISPGCDGRPRLVGLLALSHQSSSKEPQTGILEFSGTGFTATEGRLVGLPLQTQNMWPGCSPNDGKAAALQAPRRR